MGRVAPLRVLVVEDNEDVGDMLLLVLQSMGCAPELHRDGPAGLHAGTIGRFDLAILDLGLPGIDGFEVARGLRAHHGSAVMLVALSGYTQPEDARRARDAGFDRHLAKPLSEPALSAVLRIARRRRDRESTATAEAELGRSLGRRAG